MRSILVLRTAALGDFILSLPAFSELRKHFPGFNIVLLTTSTTQKDHRDRVSRYAEGSVSFPWVDLAVPHLIDEYLSIGDIFSITNFIRIRQKLRRLKCSYGIIMIEPCAPWPGRLKKLLFLKLILGNVPVIGWKGRGSIGSNREQLLTKGLLRHHVHGPLQFLTELKPRREYSDKEILFDIRIPQNTIEAAEKWLEKSGIEKKRIVVVAPGSLLPHKRWPEALYIELIDRILASFSDVFIVIVGTPSDAEVGDRIAANAPDRILNMAGKSDIPMSAALMKRSDLVVGNDGGAVHLADAVGAKVVSVMNGIEYPGSVEPWRNQHRAVRRHVSCAPCYSFYFCPLGTNQCVNSIPVSEVFLKVCEALQESRLEQ